MNTANKLKKTRLAETKKGEIFVKKQKECQK